MEPKIIIHGGFFTESLTNQAMKTAKQEALGRIIRDAHAYLQDHSALEGVVYAVAQLEDDELFNAGLGSQIQSDGQIRMSASIMDGASKTFTGVINIEHVKNPVLVANELFPYKDRVLGAQGAIDFARSHGFEYFNAETLLRRQEYEARIASLGLGTVGAVAIDRGGKIAASTSTGGKGFEMPGRISDSATVAGNYANEFCGVSCTGVGEDIVSMAMAARIVTRVTDGLPIHDAFARTFAELKTIDGFAGAIGIDMHGNMYYRESHLQVVYAAFDGRQLEVFS